MSEPEKRGSPWPWILVPIGAVSLFFVLRECQHRLPPAEQTEAPAVTVPVTPDAPAPAAPAEEAAATPAAAPAPQ